MWYTVSEFHSFIKPRFKFIHIFCLNYLLIDDYEDEEGVKSSSLLSLVNNTPMCEPPRDNRPRHVMPQELQQKYFSCGVQKCVYKCGAEPRLHRTKHGVRKCVCEDMLCAAPFTSCHCFTTVTATPQPQTPGQLALSFSFCFLLNQQKYPQPIRDISQENNDV